VGPLPYHFPQGKDRYNVSLLGQSTLAMLGITITSSEDKEASSTGMSSGPLEGHTFLLV